MRTITQRQLRDDNAEVIRAVEQGESVQVTKNGVPVAALRPMTPADKNPVLPLIRAARTRIRYSSFSRVTSPIPTEEILGA